MPALSAVEDSKIMSVKERKERLSEIAKAMAELNKMEKVYEVKGGDVNVDNRQITINVISPNARRLTERIIQGEE